MVRSLRLLPWLMAALASFLSVAFLATWWHDRAKREKTELAKLLREGNRMPPLDYGEPAGSFLSQGSLSPDEIKSVAQSAVVPVLKPGSLAWACFANVVWLRNDCEVRLHWWFEELPVSGAGPRLRLDFEPSERLLNHQDFLGPLPPKCRELTLPEHLKVGRTYALASRAVGLCPGMKSFGPIYVTPPEMRFVTSDPGPRESVSTGAPH